ncbi:enoyl-CoA hydratase-related protein [Rhodovulum tesquicola]|uniref:enoyl-CoA hydratase-related protein n=1 Tax=Rhodovulum tesquicola TaxID=540254 RepID=UPI003F49BD8A
MPDAGGTYWLPRQVGFSRAMGAALFAEPVPARQAADWGMIWEAVPEAGFEAHWRTRAAQLARGPTVAYAKLKAAIRASYANDLEAQLQGACGATRDFKEGVLAFLEKRPPRFEGR